MSVHQDSSNSALKHTNSYTKNHSFAKRVEKLQNLSVVTKLVFARISKLPGIMRLKRNKDVIEGVFENAEFTDKDLQSLRDNQSNNKLSKFDHIILGEKEAVLQ